MTQPVELLGRKVIRVVDPTHTHPVFACKTCCFYRAGPCPTKTQEDAATGTSCTEWDIDKRFAHYEEVKHGA